MNVDKNPAYPIAFEAIKHEGFFRPRSSLRQCKYLNNVIEQDHRFIKRRTRPMLGFKQFTTAWRTVRGIEMKRWTPSTGQLINVAKWNLLRYLPVKMRGAEDDQEETAQSFASV